jgi:hypothetical protein
MFAPTSKVFTKIYQNKSWGGESASGLGSNSSQTQSVRDNLPGLLQSYSIKTLLDLPCGSFLWMNLIDLGETSYIGGDIVAHLIEQNNSTFRTPSRQFVVLDLIKDPLPQSDLLLCRDCLIHLSFRDIQSTLKNISKSNISYLLTTNYPKLTFNTDILTGDFRAINLQLPPFNFSKPLAIIPEDTFSELKDNPNFIRELALWRTQDLLPSKDKVTVV